MLLLPFILSILLIIGFTLYVFKSNFFTTLSSSLPNMPLPLNLLSRFYIYSFICMTIYMLGYLVTGEILQRMFHKAKRNFLLDMIFNYLVAIPFLLILTLLWVIFALSADKKRDQSPSIRIWQSLRSLSLYALFVGFKYYTYINFIMSERELETRSSFAGLDKL